MTLIAVTVTDEPGERPTGGRVVGGGGVSLSIAPSPPPTSK